MLLMLCVYLCRIDFPYTIKSSAVFSKIVQLGVIKISIIVKQFAMFSQCVCKHNQE